MPYKGTDIKAYKKAGRKGKTSQQRSKIYYEEKRKNKIKKDILGIFSFTNKNSVQLHKKKQKKYIPKENMLDYIRKQRSSKLIFNASNSFSLALTNIFGKKLDNKEKDIVRSVMALVVSETLNKSLEKPLQVIENIKMFIKVGKVIYKVVLKLNEYTNEYELDSNDIFEVDETSSEYQAFLFQYPRLKKEYELNYHQGILKRCPLCNSRLELIVEDKKEFYACVNYLNGNCKYKTIN